MNIDYDKAKRVFTITCPVWANDLVNTLPTRRWNKPNRHWVVPPSRGNAAKLTEFSRMPGVTFTEDAGAALREYSNSLEEKVRTAYDRDSRFPAWYKFKRQPRDHQRAALDRGYKLNCMALFMDMQTGKSKTLIDLVTAHRMEGHLIGGIIFTKLTLRMNWIKHFNNDCPIPFSIHLPDTRKKAQFERWIQANKTDFPIMVVGWESLSEGGMRHFCETFMGVVGSKSFVAGDETTFITNHQSERTKRSIKIAHMASYRYALTGTPALEGPMNLYTQFEFLDPDVIGIGDYYAFRNQYAVMGGYHREIRPGVKQPMEIVGYKNLDELSKTIAPYTYQVTKAEVYDLPPKRPVFRSVKMTRAQQVLYDEVLSKESFTIKGAKSPHVMKTVLEVALRLHQIAGGYAVKSREERRVKNNGEVVVKTVYDPVELIAPGKNPKMIELCNVVEEFRGKKQGLIWAVYKPELEAIFGLMDAMGMKYGKLYGEVPERERQPMVDEFERGGLDLIIGNASTGGMGYTMQASEVNIFYNNTHKAIDRVQAEDRGYGDGQTKSAVWVDILAENTVDVSILKALEGKKNLSDFIRDSVGLAIGDILKGEVGWLKSS